MKCWRCSKRQVFVELAVGIEFIDDESFALYHKKSSRDKIVEAIRNIQRHGLSVRGLFILGADNHTVGAGDPTYRLCDQASYQGCTDSVYVLRARDSCVREP